MNRKGIEFSFGWLFAVIVGAAILFLAIYASTKFLGTQQSVSNTEAAQTLGTLMSPFETSVEASELAPPIDTNVPTRLYVSCSPSGYDATGQTFGSQNFRVSISSGAGNKQWPEPGAAVTFYNKYTFSSALVEDRMFMNVLTVPLYYPYKVADLQMVFSDTQRYCFVNAPQDFKNTLTTRNITSIQFASSRGECLKGSISVCFVSSGCDEDVSLTSNSIQKNGTTLYYGTSGDYTDPNSALMYAAVFSDPSIYECQLKRIGLRVAALARVYEDKNSFITSSGCSSNMESELVGLESAAASLNSSHDINSLALSAQEVGSKNEIQSCKLF